MDFGEFGSFGLVFVKQRADDAYQRVSRFLPISFICSGLSLIVGQPIAGLFIVGALITASFVYLSSQHAKGEQVPFFRLPISVYLGWLSIATIVEISILLKANGFSELFGLPETFWTIFVLMMGGFFAVVFTESQLDLVYPLVFIWHTLELRLKLRSHHYFCDVLLRDFINRLDDGSSQTNVS